MKIVINRCFGGFELSQEAMKRLGIEYYWQVNRFDSKLVKVVEELGEKANGGCADLKVVEIPDDVEWVIEEYDGVESIHEKHRVWC